MDGWFLKNHIINYFVLVWLQSSNFYLNKPHASRAWLQEATVCCSSILFRWWAYLFLPLPLLMGPWHERHSFNCDKQSPGLSDGPTLCGTIQTVSSELHTWIQLISVLNFDMKCWFLMFVLLINLNVLAKTKDEYYILKILPKDNLKWTLLGQKGSLGNSQLKMYQGSTQYSALS